MKPVSTADAAAVQRLEQQASRAPGALNTPTEWTFDELASLVKLSTHKFPAGTLNRWDRIAEALNRRPEAVTTMIGKLKNMDPKDYQKLCDGPAPSDNLVTNNSLPASLPVMEPTIADDGQNAEDGVWGRLPCFNLYGWKYLFAVLSSILYRMKPLVVVIHKLWSRIMISWVRILRKRVAFMKRMKNFLLFGISWPHLYAFIFRTVTLMRYLLTSLIAQVQMLL